MTSRTAEETLVVVQLTGGNDFMNTIVPYTNRHYYDARNTVVLKQDEVLPIDDTLAINPNAAPFKRLYDEGRMAIIQGIGYPDSNRSHFRGMDIWHTAEPDRVGSEGWLGQAIRELDPNGKNVLTGINIGMGLPRAMAVAGVPVTSVGDLESYGVMNRIEQQRVRDRALEAFKGMYGQAIGTGQVAEYIGQTGLDVLKGADMLADVAGQYQSNVEYADNQIAKNMRDIARIHFADLGTRIFYTAHGGYDTHANEMPNHLTLMRDVSGAISDFLDDSKSTTQPIRSQCSCLPSSGAGCATTAAAPTTAPEAAPTSSARTSRADSTASTRLSTPPTGSMAKTCSTPSTSGVSTPLCLSRYSKSTPSPS